MPCLILARIELWRAGVVAVYMAVKCAAIQLGGLGNHVLDCLKLADSKCAFCHVRLPLLGIDQLL
jgi:hypothetical protein